MLSPSTATFSATIPARSTATRTIQTTAPATRGRATLDGAVSGSTVSALKRRGGDERGSARAAALAIARPPSSRRPAGGPTRTGRWPRPRPARAARPSARRARAAAPCRRRRPGKSGGHVQPFAWAAKNRLTIRSSREWKLITATRPPGRRSLEHRRQRPLQRAELVVDGDSEGLEDPLRGGGRRRSGAARGSRTGSSRPARPSARRAAPRGARRRPWRSGGRSAPRRSGGRCPRARARVPR